MHAIHVSVAVMVAGVAGSAMAEQVVMVGGQTNVALDMEAIASATGLTLNGTSPEVVPGNLPDSVAFTVTSPLAATLPTTFEYDSARFEESASGSIEHRGSLILGGSAVLEIGDFTIVKDPTAGFRIVDNVDMVGLVLFDIFLNNTDFEPSTLDLWGDLRISADFATRLIDLGLTTDDLTGTDVGDAWVQGFVQPVPAPAVGSVVALAGLGVQRRRRR